MKPKQAVGKVPHTIVQIQLTTRQDRNTQTCPTAEMYEIGKEDNDAAQSTFLASKAALTTSILQSFVNS